MSQNIELRIGGESYTGWTSAMVQMSMDQISGNFVFTATDPFPGRPDKLKIKLGLSCEVWIEGNRAITGFIDDMDISYDSQSHVLQVMGRDVTADLVDCSHVGVTSTSSGERVVNEWAAGTKAIHIIKSLCTIFGISVVVDASVSERISEKMPSKFTVGDGDTCFSAIAEICKEKAVLPVSYGDGKLTITQAGTKLAHDILETGINIKSGTLSQSNKERYQLYIVKGQKPSQDTELSTDYTQAKGYAWDLVVLRNRSIVIPANKSVDKLGCYDLAWWEAHNRAGRSRTLTYTVQGWLQSDKSLWSLNSKVRVKDRMFNIDQEMLISEVEFSCDGVAGTTTRLTVVHPDAYKLLKTPIKDIKTGFDPLTMKSQPISGSQ